MRRRHALTWDGLGPAPYESAWSLYLKLLCLNHCSSRDLRALIYEQPIADSKPVLSAITSTAVDLQRLGRAIEVPTARLRQCFLDQLGFALDAHDYVGPRHCAECLLEGYHCTLFDLPFVARCPWHDRRLSAPCRACRRAVENGVLPYLQVGKEQDRYRTSMCEHVLFDAEAVAPTVHLTLAQQRQRARVCRVLVEWWRRVIDGGAIRDTLMQTLLASRRNYSPEKEHDANLCLGLAERTAGACPWSIELATIPGRWSGCRLRLSAWDSKPMRQCRLTHRRRAVLACIRRHVLRHYLHSHRRCIAALLKLSRDEVLAIDRSKACDAALAYVAWNLTSRNLTNIEHWSVSSEQAPVTATQLRRQPLETFAWVTLLRFICAWQQIQQCLSHDYCQFRVVAQDSPWSARLPEPVIIEPDPQGMRVLVAFPDVGTLMRTSDVRCLGRIASGERLVNNRRYNTIQSFSWATDYDRSEYVFQISAGTRSMYRYVTV